MPNPHEPEQPDLHMATPMTDESPLTSIPTLLRHLREDTTTLFRQEAALAKAELAKSARELGAKSVSLLIGALVCLIGAIALVGALCEVATTLLIVANVPALHAAWLGPLVVGAVIVAVGASMVNRAKKAFALHSLVPTETVESVKETARWAQKKI